MADLTRTPITPDLLRGIAELEPTERGVRLHRLPRWVREQLPDPQLLLVESQPAGARLAFRTTASVVELETIPTKRVYPGMPARPDGVYELAVDGEVVASAVVTEGNTFTIDLRTATGDLEEGPAGRAGFPGLPAGDKLVEIWLPHDETTELVALHTDGPVVPAAVPAAPVWLHHGSSISHGSSADRPTGTWPVVAARRGGVELVNLGLGGSALLDQAVARVIRDTPADLISLKLGINVVNHDVMRRRAFASAVHGFLDTVRDGHPTTPLLLVSPIWCGIQEDTPGPSAPDLSAIAQGELRFVALGDPAEVAAGKLTLRVIREELERIVAQRADPHLTYLDGLALFGEADAAAYPLPDDLHPGPDAHRVIGERFASLGLPLLLDPERSATS